MESLTEGIK